VSQNKSIALLVYLLQQTRFSQYLIEPGRIAPIMMTDDEPLIERQALLQDEVDVALSGLATQ